MTTTAAHWTRAADGAVDCSLCFRKCHLAPGETGWCGTRTNVGGTLVADADGLLSYCTLGAPLDFASGYGETALFLAGVSCTAACSFCDSGAVALDPQRLPVVDPRQQFWTDAIGERTPEEAIALAERMGVSRLALGGNEPLISFEWSLAAARLAHDRGWGVSLDTNGYAPPAVIREIAPYVDHALVGVKFSADESRYERHMASPGAVPHVLEAIKAWNEAPDTVITIVDVIGPPHWASDAEAFEAARRFYGWLAETCGPLTPLDVRGMWVPGQRPAALIGGEQAWERVQRITEIAREAGLLYAVASTSWHDGEPTMIERVTCHLCGGNLLPDGAPGHRCRGCGGAVPVVTGSD